MRQHSAVILVLGFTLAVSSCAADESSSVVADRPAKAPVAAATPPVRTPTADDPRYLAADLPLLPLGVERGAMPLPVIRAAYEFAARKPEVMKYMPCFCGCERGGHKDNHDCFVSSRNEGGKVTSWEPHGLECEICISVAQQAQQMHNSGASITAIRDAIEKKYASISGERGNHTPTPMPGRGGIHD